MMKINNNVALVFGISGDQGQSVASGLLAAGSYSRIYGVTRDVSRDRIEAIAKRMSVPVEVDDGAAGDNTLAGDSVAKHVTIIDADLNNAASLRRVFVRSRATDIFLVTTTDVPTEGAAMGSFHESEELEYESIKTFFDVLVEVHKKEWTEGEGANMRLERHVIFSTMDNVKGLVEFLELHAGAYTNDDINDLRSMKPLDDGGIVPHFSGKGRGGEYALKLIHGVADPWKRPPTPELLKSPWMNDSAPTPSIISGLSLTLIKLPFLHYNFALSAVPLPTTSEGRATQWSISTCLGDPSNPLDMFSVSDLKYIAPTLFQQFEQYQGRTIKLTGEKITMDEVAYEFSDLFGKDIIYSPLTLEEMSMLNIPEGRAFSQMCQYLASPYSDHDLKETRAIMSACGRDPQTFHSWLLSHSDEKTFEKVGLTSDATPIQCVAVFNALSLQGESVIKGLVADTRKQFIINACVCGNDNKDDSKQQHELEAKVKHIQSLDPERISIHYTNLDDMDSCVRALKGTEGVFLVTDFKYPHPQLLHHDLEMEDQEERQARVVIDACAVSGTVKHLVLSRMEAADDVDNELKDSGADSKALLGVKARLAAYARAKHISMTYVLMPMYSEQFFHALAEKICDGKKRDDASNANKDVGVDESKDEKVVCMSAESLGPAVANIFDSYEVYSGHEIGLVSDILSIKEATETVHQIFFESPSSEPSSVHDAGTSLAHSNYRLDIVAQDLGQMFRFYSKMDAVKERDLIAKTLKLVPDAKSFKSWLEDNRDNAEFREMLGLR
ncbi:hypothetical protein ACHAXR_011962 [Thalassiosira sp. AJA248-18]